jgi:hypothetical protein
MKATTLTHNGFDPMPQDGFRMHNGRPQIVPGGSIGEQLDQIIDPLPRLHADCQHSEDDDPNGPCAAFMRGDIAQAGTCPNWTPRQPDTRAILAALAAGFALRRDRADSKARAARDEETLYGQYAAALAWADAHDAVQAALDALTPKS